jgi:hypothetical protein
MNLKAKILIGVAVLGVAAVGPPQSAQAVTYTVRLGGSACVVGAIKLSSIKAQAVDVACEYVQARMQRYSAATIRTYYGPNSNMGESVIIATDGSYANCGARVRLRGIYSGWYSC